MEDRGKELKITRGNYYTLGDARGLGPEYNPGVGKSEAEHAVAGDGAGGLAPFGPEGKISPLTGDKALVFAVLLRCLADPLEEVALLEVDKIVEAAGVVFSASVVDESFLLGSWPSG